MRCGLSAGLDVFKPESTPIDDFAIVHDRDAQTRILGKTVLILQPRINQQSFVFAERAHVIEFRSAQLISDNFWPKKQVSGDPHDSRQEDREDHTMFYCNHVCRSQITNCDLSVCPGAALGLDRRDGTRG